MIGVGGCVASQEGANIVARAPYVDVVFGPQTLHRLPDLIARRRATGQPQVDISFPEIEKFDHLPPPKVEGATAFVSIMEGCSKYCTFCVVPYTRGEEVSRPFDDVLTEVADLADQGVMEVTLLGQNVNAYRGRMGDEGSGETADFATLIEYIAEVPGIERIRYTTSHPREMTPRLIAVHGSVGEAREPAAPARAVGLRPRARRHEAWLHRARVQVDRAPAARRAPRHLAHVGLHRGLPGRDRRRLRAHPEARGGRGLRRRLQLHLQQPPGTPAADLPDPVPHDVKQARLVRLQAVLEEQYRAHSDAMVGSRQRVLVTGRATRNAQELAARTQNNRVVNFAGDPSLINTYTEVAIAAALPHSLRGELVS